MPFINEDEARTYLYEHQSEARTYDSFIDFCHDHPVFGDYWHKSPWMCQLWETLKHRGLLLWYPLVCPKVTKLSELFTGAALRTQRDPLAREFSVFERSYSRPRHARYNRLVNDSYGGRRSYNAERKVHQHYGSKFYYAALTPNPTFNVRDLLVTGNDTRETPYFELIEWDHHTLLVLKSNLIIASRWIAVLDPGESLFEQQRFLLSEWTARMLEIGEW